MLLKFSGTAIPNASTYLADAGFAVTGTFVTPALYSFGLNRTFARMTAVLETSIPVGASLDINLIKNGGVVATITFASGTVAPSISPVTVFGATIWGAGDTMAVQCSAGGSGALNDPTFVTLMVES